MINHSSFPRLLYILGLSTAFIGQAAAVEDDVITTPPEARLLRDTRFENGFDLLGVRSIETGTKPVERLNYGKGTAVTPAWHLGQWGTRHSLQGAALEVLQPGVFRYANLAKTVTVDTVNGELTLAARGSVEYVRPRVTNEEWPHLLVEQYLSRPVFLHGLRQVRMKLQVCLSRFDDHMTSATFDPDLHAAQLQIYLTVQNCDTSSPARGDYLWFGLPLFDNRNDMPKETYHKDFGKEDTTHKFIYLMPADALRSEGLRPGRSATIDVDLLPYLSRAYRWARAEGFFPATDYDQLAFTTMHIGWELPGTYDVEARIRELEMIAVPQ